MNITIKDTSYELHFGFAFLREINKKLGLTYDGISLETGGMLKLQAGLSMFDPIAILTTVEAGLATSKNKPSRKDIELFIEELSPEEFEELLEDINESLKKANLVQQALRVNQVPTTN